MKRKILLFIICLFFGVINVKADVNAYVYGTNVALRQKPGKDSTLLARLNTGAPLTITSTTLYEGKDCDGWYSVNYGTISGYMCSSFVLVVQTEKDNREPVTEYEKELKAAGFPSSYWTSLAKLHDTYPNWVFNANVLNIDWSLALKAQFVDKKSLIDGTNTGYRSTESTSYDWLTDKFIAKESGWYNASEKLIAYYMDPRNWLTEKYIFQFEDITYHKYQTLNVVKSIFTTTANPNSTLKTHSQSFVNAATQSTGTISPTHLAARARLELGISVASNSKAQINGTSTSTYNGNSLTGYYNFFNIDANGSNPVAKALASAMGTKCIGCKFNDVYGKPWDTAEKAIHGGAMFLIEKYLSKGQTSIYYQRYNAITSNPFTNQYMTNVAAPANEGLITANAYIANNVLNEAIVFNIPVYLNMPASNPIPNPKNPNNRLSSITVNGTAIQNFSHDVFTYEVVVPTGTAIIDVKGTVINSGATISGAGNISLSNTSTVTLTVTAANGDVQKYVLNITSSDKVKMTPDEIIANAAGIKSNSTIIYGLKEGTTTNTLTTSINKVALTATVVFKDTAGKIKTNTTLATGDIITITSNNVVKSYTISIIGDANGDGKVSIADLLRTQKNILGEIKLSGAYFTSADVNNDSKVTIADLLKIQKNILGLIEL